MNSEGRVSTPHKALSPEYYATRMEPLIPGILLLGPSVSAGTLQDPPAACFVPVFCCFWIDTSSGAHLLALLKLINFACGSHLEESTAN